jgi:hypothetical protein
VYAVRKIVRREEFVCKCRIDVPPSVTTRLETGENRRKLTDSETVPSNPIRNQRSALRFRESGRVNNATISI